MFTVDPIVQLAAAGDIGAFEELYRMHNRRVYSLCLRMTRNASDAEDLTQDVFVQLFRKLKTFRGESLFTTWLHKMTVNEVLMHFRKRRVRLEQTSEDGAMPVEITAGTQNPDRMPVVDRIALLDAIRRLSPGYRAVFILHDIAGYEHNEIGKMLGCAVGTSKSQLHKARLKLRRFLKARKVSRETGNGPALSLNLDFQKSSA